MTRQAAELPWSFSDEVGEALDRQRPMVALESTLVAHGLPWPTNLETALKAEEAVREAGAVPATFAILDGKIEVGLSPNQLERVAKGDLLKVSAGDLAPALSAGTDGATTVSATVWLAGRLGIPVMSTGGIGGVHRETDGPVGDVSNDLTELGRTSAIVVSSGAKIILDLPRSLETLETLGVPVIGYQTSVLPAFYCRDSSLPLLHRVETPDEAARVLHTARQLGRPGGLLLTNPVAEDSALERAEVEDLLSAALERARKSGIRGKAVTPFLLSEIRRQTGGRADRANQALIVANAGLAGRVARAFNNLG